MLYDDACVDDLFQVDGVCPFKLGYLTLFQVILLALSTVPSFLLASLEWHHKHFCSANLVASACEGIGRLLLLPLVAGRLFVSPPLLSSSSHAAWVSAFCFGLLVAFCGSGIWIFRHMLMKSLMVKKMIAPKDFLLWRRGTNAMAVFDGVAISVNFAVLAWRLMDSQESDRRRFISQFYMGCTVWLLCFKVAPLAYAHAQIGDVASTLPDVGAETFRKTFSRLQGNIKLLVFVNWLPMAILSFAAALSPSLQERGGFLLFNLLLPLRWVISVTSQSWQCYLLVKAINSAHRMKTAMRLAERHDIPRILASGTATFETPGEELMRQQQQEGSPRGILGRPLFGPLFGGGAAQGKRDRSQTSQTSNTSTTASSKSTKETKSSKSSRPSDKDKSLLSRSTLPTARGTLPSADGVEREGIPPKWERGISWLLLEGIITSYNVSEDMSTAEVVEQLLKPATARAKVSVWESVFRSDCEHIDTLIGESNMMVSHSWSQGFVDLSKVLRHQEEKAGRQMYFFLDICCLNQHELQDVRDNSADYTPVFSDLTKAIEFPGCMVMVLDPWWKPQTLTRCWCLYELYLAHIVGSQVTMAFKDDAARELIERPATNQDLAQEIVKHVDVESSVALLQSDRDLILSLIRKDVGTAQFNEFIKQRVSQSLYLAAVELMLEFAGRAPWWITHRSAPELEEGRSSLSTRSTAEMADTVRHIGSHR